MRALISFSFFILSLFSPFLRASAQIAVGQIQASGDTIVLINGKKLNANVLEIKETSIKYRIGTNLKAKVHSIKTDRVFAINKNDGSEQVIFKPDTLDNTDFNVNQLRMFIKGEQAARTGYHNNLNKAVAFIIGVGSSYFDIYGLLGPALYSSIVGSADPDINKQKNIDPALINVPEYREGYLKITHDKKIRNSFVAGMLGFAVGFTANAIIGNNAKK